MASLSKTKSGARFIQFSRPDGTRPRIWLGVGIAQKEADAILIHIEAMIRSRRFGTALPDGVTKWLSTLPDELKQKLADVALLDWEAKTLLGPFLDGYSEARRKTHKPASLVVWGQVAKNLTDCLGIDRPLDNIDTADAERFHSFLIEAGYSATTIQKRVRHARMFFSQARRLKLVDANPFEYIRPRGGDVTARRAYVPADVINRILDEAPNSHWRLLISLARFGGLRTPSEPFSLRWGDIDWAKGRITVTSPKTEHHVGGGKRVIPIFPELRKPLEECWDVSAEGDIYIFPQEWRARAHGKDGWRGANLRPQFRRMIERAGEKPWTRLFHSLRASCETDLAARFPLHVVTSWLGHTQTIALTNYLSTVDADFTKALGDTQDGCVQKRERSVSEMPRNGKNDTKSESVKTLELPVLATLRGVSQERRMEDNGLEPMTFWLPESVETAFYMCKKRLISSMLAHIGQLVNRYNSFGSSAVILGVSV